MSDPAIIGAIVGAVLTAVLTPFVPWLVSKIPFLRDWFLKDGHPLRLVVGTSTLCAISVSLITALMMLATFYKMPELRISAKTMKGTNNQTLFQQSSSQIGDLKDNQICMFSYLNIDGGGRAGHAYIKIVNDHWEALRWDTLQSEIVCYKITVSK